jgi:putative nucleotidyltransferase with HDIG domain
MDKALKLYLIGLVGASTLVLTLTSFLIPLDPGIALVDRTNPSTADLFAGLFFWTALTLITSALPVRLPRGTFVAVSIAPIIVVMLIGGPTAAGWVSAIGTTEIREAKRRIPWYGVLANHAGVVGPAVIGGFALQLLRGGPSELPREFLATLVGSVIFFGLNICAASGVAALRQHESFSRVLASHARAILVDFLALAPLAWLMARVFAIPGAGWWATLLFALPLYTTRVAHHRFVEMREMFTQTIASLAQAVDKRDPFTSNHSLRVKNIAVDIGREMRVSEPELEALEWGGLLHDVGKIGVPDNVLLKQDRLNREERMIMNAHPVLGDEIIAPVAKLAAERPIIRHHHEWYNGSGYPDRLIGDEIPKLARILHVADAFEAMTAARPYRMTPLTAEQALAELRKFAGIQFDPQVVDAFVKTKWVEDVPDPGREVQLRPIPLLAQAAGRMSQATAVATAAATATATATGPGITTPAGAMAAAAHSEPTAPAR